MGVDENKALIRRFYEEVWAKGDPDVSDEVFHDDTSATTCARAPRNPARPARPRSRSTSGGRSRTSTGTST